MRTTETFMTVGDGFVRVWPNAPQALQKALTYWRKFRTEGPFGVTTGRYEPLFKLDTVVTPVGEIEETLVAPAGLAMRIAETLHSLGVPCVVDNIRTPMPEADTDAAFKGLRPSQVECVTAAIEAGGGVLSCATAFGKTHVMAALARAYPRDRMAERGTPLTVIAAPGRDVTFKNYEKLVELLPGREVGLRVSGKKTVPSDDVIVTTYDSLHHVNPADVGLFVGDEVHNAASDTRGVRIQEFLLAVKYGVSATPHGRYDGRDLVTESVFGPVVFSFPYRKCVDAGLVVPVTVLWVTAPEPNMKRYLELQQSDAKRRHGTIKNAAFCETVGRVLATLPPEMQTLAIMKTIKQMHALMPFVPPGTRYVHAVTNAEGLSIEGRIAPMTAGERQRAYTDMEDGTALRMLSTYVYKQGVDFPQLRTVINVEGGGGSIASEQIPGRAVRQFEGKDSAYLVEFSHPWDSVRDAAGKLVHGPLTKDDKAREKVYKAMGLRQVWLSSVEELAEFIEKEGACVN